MDQYKILVRNGTQIRYDPITSNESRVNPARALRPMANAAAPSTTVAETTADATLPIHLLETDIALLQCLLFRGISAEDVKQYFPHVVCHDNNNNNDNTTQVSPALQFYKKKSHTDNLATPLQKVIAGSLATNPFYPPKSLTKNVVMIEREILDYVETNANNNPSPAPFLTKNVDTNNTIICQNNAELLTYVQPTSSIFNFFLYHQFCDEENANNNNKDLTDDDKYYFIPFYHHHHNDYKPEGNALFFKSLKPETVEKLKQDEIASRSLSAKDKEDELENKPHSFDYTEILSETGQLWGYFVKGQSVAKQTKEVKEQTTIAISTPYTYNFSIDTQHGIMSLSESCIFLNKFPFAQHHAVVVLAQEPYVKLDHFKAPQLFYGFYNTIQYLHAITQTYNQMCDEKKDYNVVLTRGDVKIGAAQDEESADPLSFNNATYTEHLTSNILPPSEQTFSPTIVWNYLPPSAGSLIHPHLQAYVEDLDNYVVQNVKKNVLSFFNRQQRLCPEDVVEKPTTHGVPTHVFYNLQKYVLWMEKQLLNKQEQQQTPDNAEDNTTSQQTLVGKMLHQSRYIHEIPVEGSHLSVHIMAPFGPTMNKHVNICIANLNQTTPQNAHLKQHISTWTELHDKPNVIQALVKAMVFVLRCYNEMKITSYNGSSTSAPVRVTTTPRAGQLKRAEYKTDDDIIENEMLLTFSFVMRPSVPESGVQCSDTGPLERLLSSHVISFAPETYAQEFRELIDKISLE